MQPMTEAGGFQNPAWVTQLSLEFWCPLKCSPKCRSGCRQGEDEAHCAATLHSLLCSWECANAPASTKQRNMVFETPTTSENIQDTAAGNTETPAWCKYVWRVCRASDYGLEVRLLFRLWETCLCHWESCKKFPSRHCHYRCCWIQHQLTHLYLQSVCCSVPR